MVAITWQMDIKPGEFAEFAVVARNPRDKAELAWMLRQRVADGTSVTSRRLRLARRGRRP